MRGFVGGEIGHVGVVGRSRNVERAQAHQLVVQALATSGLVGTCHQVIDGKAMATNARVKFQIFHGGGVVVVNAKLKTLCVAATQSTWFCCSSGRPVVVNGLSIKLPTILGGQFQDTGLLVPPPHQQFFNRNRQIPSLSPTMSAASLKGRSFQTSSNPMYMTSKNSAEAAYRARKLVAAGQTAKEKTVPPVDHNTYHYSTVSSSYGTQIGNSDSYVARAMDPLRTEPHREPMNVNVLQEMGFNKDGDGGSAVIEFSSELKAQKTRG